ncbi:hypothetical protein MSG28_010741, partial [Choristoneura fumiferana]
LYTKGQCHGIHSFIIQVRDEETHMPLPGIKVGDIGAKLGLNSVNNGFLGFDHLRIPREQMLMKHAQVEPEPQILDYVTQQHKIFIGIAACHALRLTANMLWETFHAVTEQLVGGNLQRLPEAASAADFYAHWENSVEGIIKGFQKVALGKVSTCVKNLNKRINAGMTPEDAWNITSYTCISELNVDHLQFQYEELLSKIRPNAVGLVDAFDIIDGILQSTLGAYDGRVYERLMEEAMKSPLNAQPVQESFHKYLKPFMRGKL